MVNGTPIRADRKRIHISHLLFKNDMLLFAEANMDELHVIQKCLDLFCDSSIKKWVHEKENFFL